MFRPRGFTLLELLVVILIAGILTAIAIPSLRIIYLNGQRNAASTSLYGALSMARSEAVARNAYVLVCARSYSASYPTCQTSSIPDFTLGWVVLRDANNNGQLDSGEPVQTDVIASGDAINSSNSLATSPDFIITLTNSGGPGGSGLPFVVPFDSSGNSAAPGGLSQSFTFKLCRTQTVSGVQTIMPTSSEGREIFVDFGGRVSLTSSACP